MNWEILVGILATAAVSIPAAILVDRWKQKPNLVYWSPHTFTFELEGGQTVYSHSITVRNAGGKTATAVEVIHRQRPGYFAIDPVIPFQEDAVGVGGHVLRFPNLGRKESVTIEYLDTERAPELLNIRSADGPAKFQEMELSEYVGPGLTALGIAVVIFALLFAIYWLIRAIIFVSRAIGLL